mgnify:CR=1 FL=1
MECTRSDGRRAVKASYDPITKIDAENLAEHFESRVAHWAVIFCDHISYEWHMRAWRSWGWYVFAPIPSEKTGAPWDTSPPGYFASCSWTTHGRTGGSPTRTRGPRP